MIAAARIAILASLILVAGSVGRAEAAPPDVGTACGAYFLTQAQQLAAIPGGVAVTRWLTTQVRKDAVFIDLLVYRTAGLLRFTGFGCRIDQNGRLTPFGVGGGN